MLKLNLHSSSEIHPLRRWIKYFFIIHKLFSLFENNIQNHYRGERKRESEWVSEKHFNGMFNLLLIESWKEFFVFVPFRRTPKRWKSPMNNFPFNFVRHAFVVYCFISLSLSSPSKEYQHRNVKGKVKINLINLQSKIWGSKWMSIE